MSSNDRFEVLLSTYNGMQYLEEQLASIESQTLGGVNLRVRDDGSTDATAPFLEKYSRERERVAFHRGENIGVVSSFLWLLDSIDQKTEWVAFCDQDDVWDDDKLRRAKDRLESCSRDIPAMYFSSVRLVDESGKVLGVTSPCKRMPGFFNALAENIAAGCTIVLNRSAIELLSKRKPNLDKILMHDWWMYLVVSAFGNVIYDETPTMDYRQHSNNVVGSSIGWAHWVERFARVRRRGRTQLVDQAQEFACAYGGEQLSPQNRKTFEEFIELGGSGSFVTRLRYSWGAPVYRQNVLDDVLMRVMIVLGWR